jgi:hypothetical protein
VIVRDREWLGRTARSRQAGWKIPKEREATVDVLLGLRVGFAREPHGAREDADVMAGATPPLDDVTARKLVASETMRRIEACEHQGTDARQTTEPFH